MTHTLVTILGRAVRHDGDAGYRKATYRFPATHRYPRGREDESAFFGLALARHLKPDAIVILGTAGSMWSVLVENLVGEGSDEEDRVKLKEVEKDGKVTQPLLDRLRPLMQRAMKIEVRPRLIPTATDEREQHAILNAVNSAVRNGDLDFDLTHGFRHLGMVGFLSSFMLERLRGLSVRGLWYGALDMTHKGITPVLRLDGLGRVRRWLDALDRFDATGDYGVFAPLLEEDRVPARQTAYLEAAAFLERTLNVRDAAKKIEAFRPVLKQPLDGASRLFKDRLSQRLSWTEAGTLSAQQRELAHQYLKRRDFVRAAVFGREACVNRLLEENNIEPKEYYSEDQHAELREIADDLIDPRRWGYFALTAVRNALAHGTRPKRRDVERALEDPQALHGLLDAALRGFFPEGRDLARLRRS